MPQLNPLYSRNQKRFKPFGALGSGCDPTQFNKVKVKSLLASVGKSQFDVHVKSQTLYNEPNSMQLSCQVEFGVEKLLILIVS